MSDSSILNNAARILKLVAAGTPADQALRDTLQRTRHLSAPTERREVSRAVFTYYRWWRWLNPGDSPQKQLLVALGLQERFNRNPASVKPEALASLAVPDWLKDAIDWPEAAAVSVSAKATREGGTPAPSPAPEGRNSYPTESAWLQQLQREPVLWLRAKAGTGPALATKLGDCSPGSFQGRELPDALAYHGTRDLFLTPEFQNGEFEIQDLASQLVGHACAPQPKETWWDACAGEGGKLLHLSDLMRNQGLIWASDRSKRRLDSLRKRTARARAFNYRAAPWEGTVKLPTKTKFDGILVDAPCAGLGTWQRNPHARWTTLPKDVAELAAVQQRLLTHVAGALKPGGRLVYAVCTLTRAETTGVADAFAQAHSELEPTAVWSWPGGDDSAIGIQDSARHPLSADFRPLSSVILWPQDLNANGMFIAAWRRK